MTSSVPRSTPATIRTASFDRSEPPVSSGWPLAALSLPLLLASLGTSSANVALPTLGSSFDAPFQQVQWIVIAYLLALTALTVSAGRLADLTGRRRLLIAGLLLFTIASAACAVSPTLFVMIAARAAQGAGAAVMTAVTMAMVTQTVPSDRTGLAMGLLGTSSAIGTALGPSLGGFLIAAAGWRAIFLVNVPLGLAALTLAARHLKPDEGRISTEPVRFDTPGTLLLALTLGAYALAMTMGRGSFGLLNGELLLLSAAGAAAFVLAERRAASPLVQLELLGRPQLAGAFAMSALVSTVVMATLIVGPFYLTNALGLNAESVGLMMTCGPVVAALTGVPAGRIVDRFGTRGVTVAALVGMALGTSALAVFTQRTGVAGYVVPLAIVTAGYALFQAANNTAVMSGLRSGERGVVSGMLNLSRNAGLITGASVMGAVFRTATAAADVSAGGPAAVSAGLRTTFGVGSLLVILALVVASVADAALRRRGAAQGDGDARLGCRS